MLFITCYIEIFLSFSTIKELCNSLYIKCYMRQKYIRSYSSLFAAESVIDDVMRSGWGKVNSMLNSMLVNKDFLTWHLDGGCAASKSDSRFENFC